MNKLKTPNTLHSLIVSLSLSLSLYQVAIKTIKKSKIESEKDLIRIRREIQIMSSIQHPNIIHIFEGKCFDWTYKQAAIHSKSVRDTYYVSDARWMLAIICPAFRYRSANHLFLLLLSQQKYSKTKIGSSWWCSMPAAENCTST